MMTTPAAENTPPKSSTLEIEEKTTLLKKLIANAIVQMRQNRRDNRRRASIIRVASVLLSGVATVLLGLQIANLADTFKSIAFVLGATVTILNALEPFFNYRALWVEHEVALANMHRLQDQVDFYLAGTRPEAVEAPKLNEFYVAYNDIWSNLNQSWISYRKSERATSG